MPSLMRTVTGLVVSLMVLGGWMAAAHSAHSPVIMPLTDVELSGGSTTEVVVTVTDADGDELTLTARSSDPALARVSVSEQTLTLTGGVPGEATITVTADDGSDTATATFVVVTGQPAWEVVPTVSLGMFHSCKLGADGTVACWGSNVWGQLNGVPPSLFRVVSAGANHTCGLKPDGTVVCWGAEGAFVDDGQADVPAALTSTTFVAVSAG